MRYAQERQGLVGWCRNRLTRIGASLIGWCAFCYWRSGFGSCGGSGRRNGGRDVAKARRRLCRVGGGGGGWGMSDWDGQRFWHWGVCSARQPCTREGCGHRSRARLRHNWRRWAGSRGGGVGWRILWWKRGLRFVWGRRCAGSIRDRFCGDRGGCAGYGTLTPGPSRRHGDSIHGPSGSGKTCIRELGMVAGRCQVQ